MKKDTAKKRRATLTKKKNPYSIELRKLRLGRSEVILLGTAHVSRESVADVEQAIYRQQPDAVLIELDEGRARNLLDPDHWKHTDIVQVIKSGKIYLLFSSILLSIFQKKMGERLSSEPGAEFKKAIELAEQKKLPYYLIDREIRITLKRVWQSVGFFAKIRLISELIASLFVREETSSEDIEKLKQKDALQSLLDSLPPSFRRIREIVIDERDYYMAQKVRDIVLHAEKKPQRALIVVGAGHLRGIEEAMQRDHDMQALTAVKEGSVIKSLVAFLAPIAVIVIFLFYFTFSGNKKLDITETLKTWIVMKCSATAAITILWRPHIIAYLVGVIVSPVSTFLPLIKVGWVSALLEAMLRKPEVKDFEEMPEATTRFGAFYRNRIFRIFMIFFLGQFSSAVGYWLFLWYV